MNTLLQAKHKKCLVSQNKSLDSSYECDIYDELLTHAEIQGHVHNTNG